MKTLTSGENARLAEFREGQDQLRHLLEGQQAGRVVSGLHVFLHDLLQLLPEGLRLHHEGHAFPLLHLLDVLSHLRWTTHLTHVLGVVWVCGGKVEKNVQKL